MPLTVSALPAIPWPVLLVGAWLFTITVIAAVVCSIAKAAINKTDARDLPRVLIALAPLLTGTARSLNKLPGAGLPPVDQAASNAQAGAQDPGTGGAQ